MKNNEQPLSPFGSKYYNWLIHKIYVPALRETAAAHARGYLVEIGCGDKVWGPILNPLVENYIGVDHQQTRHNLSRADIIATAYDTTLPDECADTVWCTAVLEHLERPLDALLEAHRILKHKGKAIYSVPFFWHIHEEPRDFFRYTKYGLKYLFEQAGFEALEIMPLSGFIVTFAQEFCYWLLLRERGWRRPVVRATMWLVQQLAYRLRTWDRTPHFTWMYLVVVVKN